MLEFLSAFIGVVLKVLWENIILPLLEILADLLGWLFSSKKSKDESEK